MSKDCKSVMNIATGLNVMVKEKKRRLFKTVYKAV